MLSEFALIRRFFSGLDQGSGVVLGVGDDAALLALHPQWQVVLSVDTMVSGVHFFPDQAPAAIGHKALAAAASDLAAMGADPLGVLLALTLPNADSEWLEAFASGLAALARRLGLPLIGGDTTRGPLAVSVTVIGQVPPELALRRQGAQPGDWLVVSGVLGGAAAGLRTELARRHARTDPSRTSDPASAGVASDPVLHRLLWPEPRMALGLALRGRAHAVIDISDGLVADVGHLCVASGCAVSIDAGAVPRDPLLGDWPPSEALAAALTGGEDYELAFAWPRAERDTLTQVAAKLALPLTVIGEFFPGNGEVNVSDADGWGTGSGTDSGGVGGQRCYPTGSGGFDHFPPNYSDVHTPDRNGPGGIPYG